MADELQKLTQQQIDSLLQSLRQEAEERAGQPPVARQEHEVQPYDFRSPVKFSREQIWTLQIIHENLAKRLTASLSVYLRSKVQVSLTSVDQGAYAVFIADMPRPIVAHIVSLRPLPGRIILGIGLELATAIIDRMLGGTGLIHARPRKVTDLELAVLGKAVGSILADLAEAWSGHVELEPAIEDVVLDPMFAGVAFPSEAAIRAVFDVYFEKSSGVMNFTIPFSVLDPVAQELTSGMWASRPGHGTIESTQEFLRQMAAHVAQVDVPLSVRLTTSQVNLDEIAGLRAGDILLLDTRRDGLARVLVGSRQKYWGRPGTLDNRMAVQIEQVMESGVSNLAIPEELCNKATTNTAESELPGDSYER
ncbi:MAG: flagellar motor switch protein FliM [Anaerolineae bacterium]